jgi:hypothetical protein
MACEDTDPFECRLFGTEQKMRRPARLSAMTKNNLEPECATVQTNEQPASIIIQEKGCPS